MKMKWWRLGKIGGVPHLFFLNENPARVPAGVLEIQPKSGTFAYELQTRTGLRTETVRYSGAWIKVQHADGTEKEYWMDRS